MSESDLKRICLDTNVYIIGTQDPDSDEAQILQAIGYYGKEQLQLEAEIVLSPELIDQIRLPCTQNLCLNLSVYFPTRSSPLNPPRLGDL